MIALALLAAASTLVCPATIRSHPLATIQLFDGDPKLLTDLEPDDRGWDLKPIRSTSSPDGFFLVCGYGTTVPRLTLRIPKEADACRLTGTERAPRVSCR